MEILKEIRDPEFPESDQGAKTRKAVRAVLCDDDKMIPLLFVANHNYHKLPGGGVEEGENEVIALRREVREETGTEIEIEGEVGRIIEYRSAIKFEWTNDLKQISDCYYGRVLSQGQALKLTNWEIKEGFQLVWVPANKVIDLMEADKATNIEGSFIQERDLTFIKKALDMGEIFKE